jgi:serine protease Do
MDAVADAPVGKPAKAKVLRNNKPVSLNWVIQERADDKKVAQPNKKTYAGQKAPFDLGFTVMDPSSDLRKDWGFPDDMNQPVVIETARGSLASKAGLRVGDVILDVNKKPVENSKDVLKHLKKSDNTIRIARNTRIQIINL